MVHCVKQSVSSCSLPEANFSLRYRKQQLFFFIGFFERNLNQEKNEGSEFNPISSLLSVFLTPDWTLGETRRFLFLSATSGFLFDASDPDFDSDHDAPLILSCLWRFERKNTFWSPKSKVSQRQHSLLNQSTLGFIACLGLFFIISPFIFFRVSLFLSSCLIWLHLSSWLLPRLCFFFSWLWKRCILSSSLLSYCVLCMTISVLLMSEERKSLESLLLSRLILSVSLRNCFAYVQDHRFPRPIFEVSLCPVWRLLSCAKGY
jgi:hypothetical protein